MESAFNAYAGGRGLWPTLTVKSGWKACCCSCRAWNRSRRSGATAYVGRSARPARMPKKEFDRTVQYIYDTMEELKDEPRECPAAEGRRHLCTDPKESAGSCPVYGSLQLSLNETFATLIPAIIMGNTVVFKPARFGVLLIQPLLELFREHFPKGVVNVIYGEGKRSSVPSWRPAR